MAQLQTYSLPDIAATAEKFAKIREFQTDVRGLIGRSVELHVCQVTIVGRLHAILKGSPGVAKSMTVDAIAEHLVGVTTFKTQAYKQSKEEQFVGPVSMKAMIEEDEYVRKTKNRAAAVKLLIIDELTRAPRSLLPIFQGMMVERMFDAGYGMAPVPLNSLFGTVNHLPPDPELEAFLDRFAMKLIVQGPRSREEFVQILKGAARRDAQGVTPVPDELLISDEELTAFQQFVKQVRVPDDIYDTIGELWANVLALDIVPSPRRYNDIVRAMKSTAALDGRDEVLLDDLQMAQHSLWSTEEEAPIVYAEVVKFASSWIKAKAELLDGFSETLDRLGQIQALVSGGADTSTHVEIDDKDRSIMDHGVKLVGDQRKLRDLVERHVNDATGQDTSELSAALTQIDAAKSWVQERLLGGLTL